MAPLRCTARWLIILLLGLTGCAYLRTATKQAYYAARPSTPRTYKHLLSRATFFVFGRIDLPAAKAGQPMAVVALAATPAGGVVDVNHFSRDDSFYGLNLPAGTFDLLVVVDRNRDGFYDATEILSCRPLALSEAIAPDKVLGDFDLAATREVPAGVSFRIPVRAADTQRAESIFYPKGTLRTLDDPIFAPSMAALGLYDPPAFLETAPMMFYSLEESLPGRVPVVFVHGIGGSTRDFAEIVAHLDRTRYQPWFFYYPSGTGLDQLGAMFYKIFLSGKVIPLEEIPIVVVAHSMGGLVVREAMNRCTGNAHENHVSHLITLASPLGGHSGAQAATMAPVVIPSWRDLDPASPFIRRLHRRPLPAGTAYHLLYAYGNDHAVKLGENSDGVVPLSSQLDPAAQQEAQEQFGCNATHTGVLHDPAAIQHLLTIVGQARFPLPEKHLQVILQGGYTVPLGPNYTPAEVYCIRYLGRYMDALASGELTPAHPIQTHFLEACQGKRHASYPIEHAWLKLCRDYPDRRQRY